MEYDTFFMLCGYVGAVFIALAFACLIGDCLMPYLSKRFGWDEEIDFDRDIHPMKREK